MPFCFYPAKRGVRNLFRTPYRSVIVVMLLAGIIAAFTVMWEASGNSQAELRRLESKVRTVIELREAGAFGTGGFGGDKPMGEHDFTYNTLAKVKSIPGAAHLTRIDEYVYATQIDTSRPNIYSMVIGMRPDAEMRAIGEIDYEHASIVGGRGLSIEDTGQNVAVVGRLYALQRTNIPEAAIGVMTLPNATIQLNGVPFTVIGVYETGNAFGDNHVFVPITAFQRAFRSGQKLSKIFVTVDSVRHVEQVAQELKERINEADVVTTAQEVSTARKSTESIAAISHYGVIVLFFGGALLISLLMALVTKERVWEIGVLKAIGASNREIVIQFMTETLALVAVSGLIGIGLVWLMVPWAHQILPISLPERSSSALVALVTTLLFGLLGIAYPVLRGLKAAPLEAIREE